MVKVELFFTYYIPHIPPLIEQGSHLKTSLPGIFPLPRGRKSRGWKAPGEKYTNVNVLNRLSFYNETKLSRHVSPRTHHKEPGLPQYSRFTVALTGLLKIATSLLCSFSWSPLLLMYFKLRLKILFD